MDLAASPPRVEGVGADEVSRRVARLYERHARRLYNLALRFAGDPFEAEDLTQEAFIRIFRKLHTLRTDEVPTRWVMRVAVTTFLNHRRKRPAPAPLDDDPIGMDDGAARREALEEAARVLRRLPPVRRLIFLLVHYESRSAAEVAEYTGLKTTTVKSHLQRARRTLADLVNGREAP